MNKAKALHYGKSTYYNKEDVLNKGHFLFSLCTSRLQGTSAAHQAERCIWTDHITQSEAVRHSWYPSLPWQLLILRDMKVIQPDSFLRHQLDWQKNSYVMLLVKNNILKRLSQKCLSSFENIYTKSFFISKCVNSDSLLKILFRDAEMKHF